MSSHLFKYSTHQARRAGHTFPALSLEGISIVWKGAQMNTRLGVSGALPSSGLTLLVYNTALVSI